MKGIIGAIAGDIIGSVYEFHPIKTRDFPLFRKRSTFTDDTIMTLAVAKWLLNDRNSKEELVRQLQYFGNKYPNGGYGRMFKNWSRGPRCPQFWSTRQRTTLERGYGNLYRTNDYDGQ